MARCRSPHAVAPAGLSGNADPLRLCYDSLQGSVPTL